jgi:hypothetical protein
MLSAAPEIDFSQKRGIFSSIVPSDGIPRKARFDVGESAKRRARRLCWA